MVASKQRRRLKITIGPNAVNTRFLPYLDSRTRFLLFWGGRDSSKSDFVAFKLLLDCLQLPYFKCVMVRRYANTVAGSQVATLEAVAKRAGIHHLFKWGISPLGITCLDGSGNSFVPFGMDDMGKAKSLKDPTHAWYEEANQMQQADCDVLSTSLRSSVPGTYLQEIYTFNPDHEGDYKSFWIWQKFFEGTGNPDGTTFAGSLAVDVDGQLVHLPYQVMHSTANDNRWCPIERKATYKSYGNLVAATGEMVDAYRYRVWWLGLWAVKQTGNEWLPHFNRATHVRPVSYLPGVPIFQSWDANSLPYCAMFCAQTLDNRAAGGKLQLRVFREYAIRSPNSGLSSTGRQFLLDRRTNGWARSDVFLTGDASLKARKTGEENQTNFKDVLAALSGGKDADGQALPGCLNSSSADFWLRRNPSVATRRDFVNLLLAGHFPDIELVIDSECTELVADCELTQLGVDGKLKELYTDKALNVRYQLRGHFLDILEYFLVTVLAAQYEAFKATRGA
ncbi:phage terminase large subunit [Hymenobacter lapidiphilus]|uniref:Phage terminase large subunit N-terminal domain-containing protein n=1 Tax=Hymenobacter lapidiphilus TaxID=2608003 RepID=A0A7Y7U7A7_9BACT|nr:phage terminase large subunit [Hymenobacter lapidiphilus]NVO33222.1 hypothetical protein [Hymenobacter lapidiphilus]